MDAAGIAQILVFCAVLTATVPLVGGYMARVYTGQSVFLTRLLGPVERGLIGRRGLLGAAADERQDWRDYAKAVLIFSTVPWMITWRSRISHGKRRLTFGFFSICFALRLS